MAVSEAVIKKLEDLKANIQAFLKLHKNPYDSTQHNELAAKLERIESILCSINHDGDHPTGDDTNTGAGDGTGMGGDDTNTDAGDGTGMGGDVDDNNSGNGLATMKDEVETLRAGAREALSTVEDVNAAEINIEDAEKAKIDAYVAKAAELLQAYQDADEAVKNTFDESNSGYIAELQQSHDWNANDFLPRANGGTPVGDDTDASGGTDTSNLAKTIGGSVGKGGKNDEADVRTVQGWLNSHGASLEVDGKYGNGTLNEIKKFQRRIGQTRPDGLISPGRNTWKGLIGELPVGPASTGVSSIIQGGESGAAGYNAYNRGTQGNSIVGPNGPRQLVDMTLATIMTNQSRARNHPDYLFAVGKYQMIPDTLKEGVQSLNLDRSLKYNESTQELLFSGYLMDKKRPQISQYVKGQPGGTAYKAGLAGAQEWASIAVPAGHAKAGRSYYDGVGGNSAHITAEDFLGALNEAKAAYQKYLGQGMSDADAYHAAVSGLEDTANSGGSGSTGDDTGAGTGDTGAGTGDGTGAGTGDGTGAGTGDDTGAGTGDDTGAGTGDNSNLSLSSSVGDGGTNNEADVTTVQELLNGKGAQLTVDGKNGRNTINAIRSFQSSINIPPDGLISPNKNTWKGLIGSGGSVDTTASSGSNGGADPGEPLEPGSRPSTANFKLEEFCVSGSYPHLAVLPPQRLWAEVQKTFNNLEIIRAAAGVPLTINSGYRGPALNSAVGGASSSKHMLCQATDISCSLSPSRLHAIIKGLMDEGKISAGGLSEYSTFVHYDTRGSYVTW